MPALSATFGHPRWTRILLSCVLIFAGGSELGAQTSFRIEGGTFFPFNLPMPLTIHQGGEPDIYLTAHYASEPFAIPICWVWRIGLWSQGRAWELEAVHHKLFLENRPPEVGAFQVTHGLNQITINRAWTFSGFEGRVGAGVIFAHPETTVRGKTRPEEGGVFNLGYFLTGPTVQGAIGRRLPLAGGFFLEGEIKLSAYLATVPISEGDAHVSGILAQLSVMVGWQSE